MITEEQMRAKRREYEKRFKDCFPNEPGNWTYEEEYAAIDRCLKNNKPYEMRKGVLY